MMIDTKQRLLLLPGEHDDPARNRKFLEAGLVGPAQGSAGALKGETQPVARGMSQTSRGITVVPPEVIFEDVRAGLLFVLTFSVQNTSGETRRLHVIPPRTPAFSINYEPIGGLAPGLDVRAEVEFQLPDDDEVDDLSLPFAAGEVREYVDKFVIISGDDTVEVPLLARRPTPAVVHNRAVEFGTVSDEKKAHGAVSLVNNGSRKAAFSVTWDKTLPVVFSPSEGILREGRGYRDVGGGPGTTAADQRWKGSVAQLEVSFDATRWSITEPFRALAKLVVAGQDDSIIDLSATVCTQKLKLLDGVAASASELTSAEFGTLHYGCQGQITSILFNDGPEAAPFIVTVEVEGGHRGGNGGMAGAEEHGAKETLPFEVEPRDGTIPPYGRQKVTVRFLPNLPPRLSGFKGGGCEQEPLPSVFKGRVLYENAEKRGDSVSLALLGRAVLPTVKVTRRVVRFGTCPCYDRRDVVVGISNTGELPIRFSISKAPNFSSTPPKGLLQPMQSQNTVLTFCPTQLGHFRGVLKLSLGSDILVIPIRVVGEASTVGTKQPRPGGIDKLPADFKPKFNFVHSESASGIRRAAEGKEAWLRPKPFETVNALSTNSWDCSTHTIGDVGGVDRAFSKLTFSLQDLARKEQARRDSDAWITAQRLKRAKLREDREAYRAAKAQGRDWTDPEGGVDIGMDRWMQSEEPVPKLPPAEDEPLFLLVPLSGQGGGDGAADVKADIHKLITRKFKQRPATQAEMKDCSTVIGRDQLAKVDLHYRTLDFGQVTVGSSNVRNLAVTNNLPQAVIIELEGLEGQAELSGTGPPAQVVPAGVTAGFDMHFKCHTEQVFRKALKMRINNSAVHQFSLLAHTVPARIELDRDEVVMKFPPGSLDATLRQPLALTNEGNATALFTWINRGAFSVSPEKGMIGPKGRKDAELVWTPQPGCKSSENLVLKVEEGQDKTLQVSGKLPEARCRFAPPSNRGTSHNAGALMTTAATGAGGVGGADDKGAPPGGGSVLDFGRASVGVEVVRTVMLQNLGKSPAVFFLDAAELKLIDISVEPTRGLIEPKQSRALTVVLRASRELRLDGSFLSADVRGGKAAKIPLSGSASIPEVSLSKDAYDFGSLTAGGCEALDVTFVNRGLIPASLQLDLSQHEEFHLERKTLARLSSGNARASGGISNGGGIGDGRGDGAPDDLRQRGANNRATSGIEDIESFEGDSQSISQPHLSGCGAPRRKWKLLVGAGDTLGFSLVFRPQRPGEHSFPLPLSLEGISAVDGATQRLRVPVSAVGLKPTLTFASTEVDFGRVIVSRDPLALKQYQGEFTLRNSSDKGLCWVMDDAYLKESGPRAEGIADDDNPRNPNPGVTSMAPPPHSAEATVTAAAGSSGPATPVLYASPTSGQLSPGEESRIRLTFTPNRVGALSFALPIWLARLPQRGKRPYLTLHVKGFGVFPCLTFTHSPVELPVVPLSITSRAVFMVESNGFSDMEVSYRLPQHCPVDMVVSFPEGRQLGAGAERIPVELSFRSAKPVSFSCTLDVFDADGGHYPLPFSGCADNCLLTNFPFVEAYRHRFNFWARDGKAVMFMTETQIKAQEAKDFKDRQAKRARAKAKQNTLAAAGQQQQRGGDAFAHGQSTASLPKAAAASNNKLDHQHLEETGGSGGGGGPDAGIASGSTVGTCVGGGGEDGVDAGVDLSEEAYSAGADEAGARLLCAWLNANVATTSIEEFPRSICEAHGRPALEAIETMSGKRVPGQVWRKLGARPGDIGGGGGKGGGGSLGRADERVAALMDQYRQMLRFLGEKGCLLNSVRPEELLDRADYARERASARARGGPSAPPPHPPPPPPGAAAQQGRGSRSSIGSNEEADGETRDGDGWFLRSRQAWSTVMYQCIRSFVLARVTPRALSALPGVFMVLPTKKPGRSKEGGKAETDSELAGSNVLSVGEGVLLRWMSYHLEQANRTCVPKRVSTFSSDLADGSVLCQTVASHVPHFTVKGAPLHGFIPVHSTGELSDQSNRELNVSKLLTAMVKLRMDFGLTVDDVLELSDRDGVLLALHLFQALPQLVPKTEVEFRANLGSVVSKSIELKNPSSSTAIKYDVTLEGSSDFRAGGNEVYLEPGKEADFTVELLPRFSAPVEARLTFWAARNKGGMAPAANMVFALRSKVESVKAISVTSVEGSCYESQTISLQVSNPFEESARNASDGRFRVSLKQTVVSEHPAVANLTLPGLGRRASAAAVAAARRRASSVLLSSSSVPSKSVASGAADAPGASSGPLKTSKDGGGAGAAVKKGRDGGAGGGVGAPDDGTVRDEVEAALKFPFYTDQGSLSIPMGGAATLSVVLLPFSPGEYKCTIMFWNERLGEFAHEVKASVNLPLPIANLSLRITAKDGSGGGGEAVQRELLLPSKNAALQNALLGALLERFQSDRKTRARQAMISICSDLDQENASAAAAATAADGASKHIFAVEVDSPFFQLSKESVALAFEAFGAGGGSGGGVGGGNSGGMTARNTARGGMNNGLPGNVAAGAGGNNKRRDIPKRAELVAPGGSRAITTGVDVPAEAAAAAVGAGSPAPPLLETNSALVSFFPRAAGTYPCRLLVKRRTRHLVDIRCVDITAVVDAPRNTTALVFRAPAGQTIIQEIPIHNNGEVTWTLNAGPRQPPFAGPNQLVVPARGKASYPLTFSPLRTMEQDVVSKLILTDLKDKNKPAKFEFELRGTAEEPLAEEHRVVRCSARERVEQVFRLRNVTGKDLEYTVDSDLPGVTGSPSLIVPAKQEAEYKLSICPQFGGVFTGSLTFSAPGGIVVWYTVEVQASNPLEEDKVSISTVLRQAVSVEISLSNPLSEKLQFMVSLQGEGLLGDATFTLDPLASSTYTLYYSPLRVQSHTGSVTFSAEAVGQFWYRLELRADPCPPVKLDEISCPVGASRGVVVTIDNPVGRDIVLASKISNDRNFAVEPSQIPIDPYGTASFEVVYTPSSLGKTEIGDVILTHSDLGDWVFEASGVGEMPGVMGEHRTIATVGGTTSTMFPFRNPFPEPLLLAVVLKSTSGGQLTGQISDAEDAAGGGSRATEDDESSTGTARNGDRDRNSAAGGSDSGGGGGGAVRPGARRKIAGAGARETFVLLLKRAADLVLQPFQALQIPLSFSPTVIAEDRAVVEVRGQLGGRSLTWVFPIVGVGEAPGGLRLFSISCPAKSSTREYFEVELVGLADVREDEEFEFEVVLPEDAKLKRALDRALSVVPITTRLSNPRQLLKFQISLEPLKPFRAIVEVIVKRKTGGGRWRYEVKVEATDADPDDSISLRASVGEVASAVFRLCNRYLGYAPFQAYFTAESALSLSVEPSDGVLTPFGTDGTPLTVTYSPTRYAPNQRGLLVVETEDIRWTYAITGDFPGFRPPTGVSSKVDSGSHVGSRKKLTGIMKGGVIGGEGGAYNLRSAAIRTPGGESTATGSSWNAGRGGVDFGSALSGGRASRLHSPAAAESN